MCSHHYYFIIAMIPLNYIFPKCNKGNTFTESHPKNCNHLMFMECIRPFAKYKRKKNW